MKLEIGNSPSLKIGYGWVPKLGLSLCLICLSLWSSAQTAPEKIQMADGLWVHGKIYVVVAVLLTVLLGLFFYLFSLDKKISKLEKNSK